MACVKNSAHSGAFSLPLVEFKEEVCLFFVDYAVGVEHFFKLCHFCCVDYAVSEKIFFEFFKCCHFSVIKRLLNYDVYFGRWRRELAESGGFRPCFLHLHAA